MITKILILFSFSVSAFAGSLSVVSKPYEHGKMTPEIQSIIAELSKLGDFSNKAPEVKKISRGEQVVAEAKARNKAFIASQNAKNSVTKETDSALSDLDRLKMEDQKTRDGWKKEVSNQLKLWQREQDIFLGRLKVYKENTFEIPVAKEAIVEKEVVLNVPSLHLVNEALSVTIKDQASRPTCSAFAGIRAIEILLAQNNVNKDLSEQYLYWASKPDCQSSPCDQKGSWVTSAYRWSQKKTQVDIPAENDCVYQVSSVDKNETQIPLSSQCQLGSVKVESFSEVKTLADVVERLKNHTPVIVAAKLSENFYKNSGLITLADAEKMTSTRLDNHSLGHAFLAVGVMELPRKIQPKEGQFCLIVANSWGKGWGAGGYSCITEKWFTKFRQPAPFIAVTKISSK